MINFKSVFLIEIESSKLQKIFIFQITDYFDLSFIFINICPLHESDKFQDELNIERIIEILKTLIIKMEKCL